jgi:uncharacterized membrane protein YccC
MSPFAKVWPAVHPWLWRHRVQLRLALRVMVAAVLALALAQFANLRLPLWAVLTAVLVTQLNVGRSLKAATDYLIGTLWGVVCGGLVALLIPHPSEASLLLVLAIVVAPLVFLSTLRPSLSAAPVTAIIVLLVPTITHTSTIASAIDRVLEVALGALIGFAVSALLLPSRAHGQAVDAAARTLNHLARAVRELVAGLIAGLDVNAMHRIQDGIGRDLMQLNVIAAEAERERLARIATAEPDCGPLLRTLLRLRHDLVMIGRAAGEPLPEMFHTMLRAPLERVAVTLGEHLEADAKALLARQGPPPLDDVNSALNAFSEQVTAVRRQGLTRGLSDDAAERFFAIGFALDQMQKNLQDLQRCISDWAERPKP